MCLASLICVTEWWGSFHVNGQANFTLMRKLKLLKHELKRWNVELYGNLGTKIQKCEKVIDKLENLGDQRNLNEVEAEEMQQASTELWKLSIEK